jgi:hypothetical protein
MFKFLLLCIALLSLVAAQDHDDAARNMQLGMMGLKEAGNDPALLAQLMQDMQDPEIMAEAQKMMADPAFQKEMKKLSGSKEFKESSKQAQDMLNDPNQAAHAEAKLEHMVKVGSDTIKKGAKDTMSAVMDEMDNPEMMAEMKKMAQDPAFKQKFEEMSKDPQFQSYIAAAKDMMKDPAARQKLEALKATM